MNKRLIALGMSLALAVTTLSGCNTKAPAGSVADTTVVSMTTDQTTEGAVGNSGGNSAEKTLSGGGVTYATILMTIDDYSQALAKGGEEICQEFGWKNLTLNSETDVQTQIDCIQSCISQGTAGLYVHDIDAVAISPILKKALDAGVFISSSSKVKPSMDEYATHDLAYYVEWDDTKASYDLTKAAIEGISSKGKLLIISGPIGYNNVTARSKGIHKAIEEYTDVELVNEIDCNWDRALAMSAMEDAITANPDVNAVVVMGESMTWGVVEALETLERDDIYVATFDTSRKTMQMVIDGTVQVCIGSPAAAGTIAGATILKAILDGKDPSEADVDWIDVDEHIVSCEFKMYDQSNADLNACDY